MKKILLLTLTIFTLLFASCSQTNQTGSIHLKLTDAPGDFEIDSAMVTISSIAVHKADTSNNESESSWVTVIEAPQTFNLVELVDAVAELGSSQIKVGKYTQVRLSIDSAVITVDGIEYNLDVPSDKLKLTKGFTIEPNKTTTLTLDFDIKESVTRTGKGNFILKPTIKIIEGEVEKEKGNLNENEEELSDIFENSSVRVIDLEGFNYGYNLEEIKLKKGEPVRLIFRSTEGFHDFVVDELDIATKKIKEGEIDGVTFTPDIVGEFEFYCSVGQHRENGMFGTIIVEE